MVKPVVRSLLEKLFDYAGLYPPSSLPMPAAVREYRRLTRDPTAWMVGPFVIDVPRLEDFERSIHDDRLLASAEISVSLLAGTRNNLDDDLGVVDASTIRATIVQIETATKTLFRSSPGKAIEGLRRACARITHGRVFIECTPEPDGVGALAPAVAHSNATHDDRRIALKVRCGGPLPGDVPPIEHVALFVGQCARHDVPFKATAGLHHPVRAVHTEFGSDGGIMHGFLNVLLATALARRGGPNAEIKALLSEQDRSAFKLSDESVRWRHLSFSADEVTGTRENLLLSIGTCSVAEPVADLAAMQWLPEYTPGTYE